MAIPRDTIEIIRDRTHIEEIVKKYVPSLQKKGTNYVGLCPFHKEKTPSFTVSPEKKIFYCFGCHTGGSVFTFISKIEKLSFPESVRFLGNILGIKVQDEADSDKSISGRENQFAVNKAAMLHFINVLNSVVGKKARDYLLNRGVFQNSIKEFSIGYAPDEWNSLVRYLSGKRDSIEEAVKAGLVVSKDKDGSMHYYDRFRGRVMFPIFTNSGDVAAFGGRIIGNEEPKYLNSPESEIFKKGNILYGLNIARSHIKELKRAIVVEGYLDVIGCHQNGIKNVVAPLGTALTLNQLRILARLCSEIVLLFDADSAGVNASLRSLEVSRDINVDIKVAELPAGDPFEFITARGVREFMSVVDSAIKPVDFRINKLISAGAGRNRIELLKDAFGIIREIDYETERSYYLRKLGSLLNIEEKDIRADYKKINNTAGTVRNSQNTQQYNALSAARKSGDSTDHPARIFRELVLLICHYPELIEQAMMDISENIVTDPLSKGIFKVLRDWYSKGEKITLDRLIDHFSDGNEKEFLENNLFREYIIESPKTAYTEIYINLRLFLIDQKINKYADELKKSDLSPHSDIRDYLAEIEILRREKEKLSSYLYNKQII